LKSLGERQTRLWDAPLASHNTTPTPVQRIECTHDIANLLWAYAKAADGIQVVIDGQLLDAIAGAAPLRINEFSPQALSNTAWSFATLNHDAPALFDAIARAAQLQINEFSPQALSNTAWSFASLNHEATSLLEAIS
jgi:hypothetical protein